MRIRAGAAWINSRELARDVDVVIEQKSITGISAADTNHPTEMEADLLLPGFINAHCHLEYTALAGKLPRGSVPFGVWLDAIVAAKAELTPEQVRAGFQDGIQQLLAGGCTAVIDSTTLRAKHLNKALLKHFVLHEVLGLSDDRAAKQLEETLSDLDSIERSGTCLGAGINPHAPYSVGPALRGRLREVLRERPDLVCGWHLAETPDEEQVLMHHTGSIAEFLSQRGLTYGAGPVDSNERACAAMQMLEQEELRECCDLAFHLNCAGADDRKFFRAPRGVVHCPGTHSYFSRGKFPMVDFLTDGANVCLGTDSLASADTLDMLQVVRTAAKEFPELSGSQLLHMVTCNPGSTRALAAHRIGTLAPGYAADMLILRCQHVENRSLRELLCDELTVVQRVLIDGAVVYDVRGSVRGVD
ncbi:MAG: amidohydrolase family protein [Candidatus Sumerlaeaceae bacterium]